MPHHQVYLLVSLATCFVTGISFQYRRAQLSLPSFICNVSVPWQGFQTECVTQEDVKAGGPAGSVSNIGTVRSPYPFCSRHAVV